MSVAASIAIIPARSGSKGLPQKNILPLAGKPLLAYSIDAAVASGCFDYVMVSTDAEEYAAVARTHGADVPFLRHASSATDQASSWQVVRETLARLEAMGRCFETVTLLQPTSPLRTEEDIRGAMALFHARDANAVVSVCEMSHSYAWINTLPDDRSMANFIKPEFLHRRRQDLPPYYRLNGAIYIVKTTFIQASLDLYSPGTYAYIMPEFDSLDIDGQEDFVMAEALLRHRQGPSHGI